MKKVFNIFVNVFITLPLLLVVFIIGIIGAVIGIILYYSLIWMYYRIKLYIAKVKLYGFCPNMPIAMYRGTALFWIEQQYI